jgi:D-xylose transport system ATP-binding protein
MLTSPTATPTGTRGVGAPLATGPAVPSPKRQPLLVAKGMTKRFGQVEALVDANLELYAGEVVALVGDTGAGKSTQIKAIAGVQPADAGEILIDGKRVHIRNASDAYKHGIATVYQDLALCDNLDVVANLFLGGEKLTGLTRVLDEQAMEHKTIELLDSLGVTSMASVRARVGSLSGGQRQAVAIARSLLGEPKLVILDEPTAALGITQTGQVLALIERLRDQGLAVVVISHNLANVFHVADRIVVLRLGRRAATFDRRTTSQQDVVAAITGARMLRPELLLGPDGAKAGA